MNAYAKIEKTPNKLAPDQKVVSNKRQHELETRGKTWKAAEK